MLINQQKLSGHGVTATKSTNNFLWKGPHHTTALQELFLLYTSCFDYHSRGQKEVGNADALGAREKNLCLIICASVRPATKASCSFTTSFKLCSQHTNTRLAHNTAPSNPQESRNMHHLCRPAEPQTQTCAASLSSAVFHLTMPLPSAREQGAEG